MSDRVDRAGDVNPATAAAILRAYVLAAVQDRNGRELSPRSRLAALDALDVVDAALAGR